LAQESGITCHWHIGARIGNIVGKSFGKPPVCHGDTKESVYPVTSGVPGCWFCKRSPLADDL